MSQDSFLEEIAEAVHTGNQEKSHELTQQAIFRGIDPMRVIEFGLAKGVKAAGDAFGRQEMFLTDLMMAAEAMKSGMSLVLPLMETRKDEMKARNLGTVLMATVEGDIHDIGKNLCCVTLSASGFDVIDMGVDVTTDAIVNEIESRAKAGAPVHIVGLSCLMTITKQNQKKVVEVLKKGNIKTRTMVGGSPTDQKWAAEIGADAYGQDASNAVDVAKELVTRKN